jgi:4-carboxymuconolactone decarboxylase
MAKIRPIPREEATPEQQRVGDAIFGSRNEEYGGPSAVLLHVPEMAQRFEDLRASLIGDERLPKPALHLAALLAARFWSSQYTWWKRVEMCRAAGIPDDVIGAVRDRRRPVFADPVLEVVYDYVAELLESGRVDERTDARALELLGEEAIIQLVLIVGFYSMLALVSDAFEPELPPGVTPPLEEPGGTGGGRLLQGSDP